jgi:predicted small secreted protein
MLAQHPIARVRFAGYRAAMKSCLPRFVIGLLTAALLLLVTSGCQTSKGFGKDVEKLGEKIQDKAK